MAENRKGTGYIWTLVSMPLSAKLFFLVLVTLLTRILVFMQPQIITNDGTLYVKMARLFSEGRYEGIYGGSFTLYPFVLFLVKKLVGDWELSGQLISITLGTLTVIPVFLLGRSLYDEKLGWLSALFYISLPNFLRFDSQVIRDPTLWFFMAFSFWLVWEGLKKNRRAFLGVASISAGLGALTRVEGFILWGILVFYAVFRNVPEIPIRRKALNVMIFIFLFPILLSPALFVMKEKPSRIAIGEMISYSAKVVTVYTPSILKPLSSIDAMGQKTYDSLPRDSRNSLELASRHRFVLAISEVIYKFIKSANLLIILILLGVWKREKGGFQSSDWYLSYIFVALFIMSIFYARQLYYFSTRHGLTLVLPCLFFAGHGLDAAIGILSRRMERLGSRWALIRKYFPLILTFFLILSFFSQGLGGKGKEKTTIKEAGLWLKENGYQGSVVMGPKKFFRLAFYADGTFIEMPGSSEKIIETIRQKEVKIVVIDSCTIEQDCLGFLENWPRAGLFEVKAFKWEKEKCVIQMYRGP